ncbi:hypothetical protein GCM10011498_36440 [Amylibacter cionae]|jgi:hypothetical protein|uniref:Lipoprotein n=1 Tax=Neptunicoccus cionae TaxID=2035344 RepID=A0A916VSX5_9RHOB|nr:hypothetical protein [Roseobacter sp. N2S]GGA31953.1 hypothetical protein GCM10011498_36440 [Amylibacter cionae]
MKLTITALLGVLALSACTNYQGPKANCFDGGSTTRAKHDLTSESLSFAAQSNATVSTRNAPMKNCTFEALAAPAGPRGQ